MTEDEMVGWHHQLNAYEFKQTPGDGEGWKPGVLQSTGSQRVRHNLATEQQQQNVFDAGGFNFVPARALGTIISWGHLWEGHLAMGREAPVIGQVLYVSRGMQFADFRPF